MGSSTSVDIYFSHTRGIKMDTEFSEPESRQGAVKSVALPLSLALSRQEPQGEVVDPKSSAASSEEERLAAGILTMGLHAKRLSGAQWRKLTRERKIREGTWMERKPTRKIPISSDKSGVRSSGGVKTPHSDSSTPMLERQQLTKPRSAYEQTGSYKEAVVGIKMAITDRHPQVKLDQTQADMIQAKLLVAVDAHPMEETPLQFLYSKFAQGVLWFTCANEFSQAWLLRAVSEPGEPWEGTELTVIDSKDLPKRPMVLVCIPDASEFITVLTCLRALNPGLDMSDWIIMSCKIEERGQMLTLSIDPNSYKTLTLLNFKAFWGLGRISFWALKDNKKYPEDVSTASKPPSQHGGLGCTLRRNEEV
jgi:hypothetical protein